MNPLYKINSETFFSVNFLLNLYKIKLFYYRLLFNKKMNIRNKKKIKYYVFEIK